MAQRKSWVAIRDARLARPVRWLALALAGAVAGVILGELVAGSRFDTDDGAMREAGGYAGLSANPDAAVADARAAPTCVNCADSYGAAARLRARRAERAEAILPGLPETAPVDPDAVLAEPAPEPADGYRYGGGLPEPERAGLPPAISPPAVPKEDSPGEETPAD